MKFALPGLALFVLLTTGCSSVTYLPTVKSSPININDQTDTIHSDQAPAINQFPKFTSLPVNHFTLENGLTVLHYQTHRQLVDTTLLGLFLDNPQPYNPINLELNANWNLLNIGKSHYKLTALAANLGAEVHRLSDSIATGWYFEVLNNDQKNALQLISTILNGRVYNDPELVHQKQKYSLQQQLKKVSGLSLSQQLYKNLVYSKKSSVAKISRPSSRKKLLEKITESSLKNYFESHFVAKKMVLIILSPTPPDQLKALIQKTLKQFPQTIIKSQNNTTTKHTSNASQLGLVRPSSSLYAISRPHSTQVDIRISFTPMILENLEYQSLKLFADVLAGTSLNSRMQSDLRERQGLSYSISHQLSQVSDFHSLHFLSSTENQKLPALFEGMQQHINYLLDHGISEKEFNFIKQRRLVNLQRSRLHRYRKMSFMLQNFTNKNPLDKISHEALELSKLTYKEFLQFVKRLKKQPRISIFIGDKSQILHHFCSHKSCPIQWYSNKLQPQN